MYPIFCFCSKCMKYVCVLCTKRSTNGLYFYVDGASFLFDTNTSNCDCNGYSKHCTYVTGEECWMYEVPLLDAKKLTDVNSHTQNKNTLHTIYIGKWCNFSCKRTIRAAWSIVRIHANLACVAFSIMATNEVRPASLKR